jgi:integrase
VLFPRDKGNRDGTKPIRGDAYGNAHRVFADAIAHLLADADGQQIDPALVVPYAYRHSYAQRHADAGVGPDVLRELMSHRSMRTTTGYYRITETRELIRRIEADLETLSDEDRARIENAIATIRATRQTVMLGMPAIRPAAQSE